MMGDLIIHEPLASTLRERAEKANKSIEELIEGYLAEPDDEQPAENPMRKILQMIRAADIPYSGETDVSERTKEILNTEYADYLIKRMRGEDGGE